MSKSIECIVLRLNIDFVIQFPYGVRDGSH